MWTNFEADCIYVFLWINFLLSSVRSDKLSSWSTFSRSLFRSVSSRISVALVLAVERQSKHVLLFLATNLHSTHSLLTAQPLAAALLAAGESSTNHNGISLFVHETRPFVYIAKRSVRILHVIKCRFSPFIHSDSRQLTFYSIFLLPLTLVSSLLM